VANPEHLAELNKGVKSWNRWRIENPSVIPDLKKANLSQTDLRKADLSLTDLSFADLRSTKLNRAKFSGTCLTAAQLSNADLSSTNLGKTNFRFANFSGSNLSQANLSNTDLRSANFSSSNLSQANLNGANLGEAYLRKAVLNEANLSKAILKAANLSLTDLSRANLSQADLNLAVMEGANLQNADLSFVQALGTDFKEADLTGVCIQDWNLNSKTNLNYVKCDYVYLKKTYDLVFTSIDPIHRTFQPGEFTQKFQPASETTDIVANGITEFLESFEALQQNHPHEVLSIHTIEAKSESKFVARLEVLPESNPEEAKNFYEEQIQLFKANYALQVNNQLLELSKQHNADIMELAKLAIGKSYISNLNLEVTAMSNSEGFTNNLQGANIANFSNQVRDNARQQANQYNYSPSTKSLTDTAKEIQALLDHLSQTYTTHNDGAKRAFANEVIQRIDNDPSFTQRILSALSAGSTSALEQLLNHPAASFVISALEDWQKTRLK
jgi:uncharacterized protein YjbI with pentapeptide repeats